jgi:membrane-bound ClpP family serine protease
MTPIIVLFLLGIVLLAADVFVASFVLAMAGGAAMFVAVGIVYRHFGATDAGVAGLLALGLLAGTIYVELILLPRTRLGRGLILHSTSGGAHPAPAEGTAAMVGRPAEALTTLAPSGYVLVDGSRFEAFCQSGHAPAGAALRVIGRDNFRLIVSQL